MLRSKVENDFKFNMSTTSKMKVIDSVTQPQRIHGFLLDLE